jgi:hypothetical protein
MTPITQGDFQDWKNNKVTEAFFSAAKERIAEAKSVLSVSAGSEPLQDRFLVGLIHAYTELQDFYVEDSE